MNKFRNSARDKSFMRYVTPSGRRNLSLDRCFSKCTYNFFAAHCSVAVTIFFDTPGRVLPSSPDMRSEMISMAAGL